MRLFYFKKTDNIKIINGYELLCYYAVITYLHILHYYLIYFTKTVRDLIYTNNKLILHFALQMNSHWNEWLIRLEIKQLVFEAKIMWLIYVVSTDIDADRLKPSRDTERELVEENLASKIK